MATREEIGEGIAEKIATARKFPDFNTSEEVADRIIEMLNSVGVVLKVEGELPENHCEICEHYNADAYRCCEHPDWYTCIFDYTHWKLKASYVKTEPLI